MRESFILSRKHFTLTRANNQLFVGGETRQVDGPGFIAKNYESRRPFAIRNDPGIKTYFTGLSEICQMAVKHEFPSFLHINYSYPFRDKKRICE